MALSTAGRYISNRLLVPVVAALGLAASSCDSWIYDDQGDCSVNYSLSFRTLDIENNDIFASQVTDLNVSLYDKEGNMVVHTTAHRDRSEENDFRLAIDVAPGTYDIIAWCSGPSPIADATSFTLTGQEKGDAMTASGAYFDLLTADDGSLYFNRDLNRLYYGIKTAVEFPDTYGNVDLAPIYLTKDTNHILLQLQNMDNLPLDPDIITFELEGSNNRLDWQNLTAASGSFVYRPWSVRGVATPNEIGRASLTDPEMITGVIAEMTTSRLLADKEQYLTVRVKGQTEPIFRIRLIEYLMLIRSEYTKAVLNQDYLDRVDDFSLTFFVDENYTWMKSRILINGWRVVPPQSGNL